MRDSQFPKPTEDELKAREDYFALRDAMSTLELAGQDMGEALQLLKRGTEALACQNRDLSGSSCQWQGLGGVIREVLGQSPVLPLLAHGKGSVAGGLYLF